MPSITLTLPSAGQVIAAGLHATNYTNLQTLLNGGLDATNISDGVMTQAKMAAGNKVTAQALSSGPPASPTTGDIWIATGVGPSGEIWKFRYNGSSASAYKWEFLGGADLLAHVGTSETLTTVGAWSDLATVGPTITVPRGGTYQLQHGAYGYHSAAGATIYIIVTNDGTPSYMQVPFSVPGIQYQASMVGMGINQDLSLGQVLKQQYYNSNTGTATFAGRTLRIRPIRIS